ncbi:MAG TPA: ABC transporter ATP-binding protein [Pseudolysinimonas sp.]
MLDVTDLTVRYGPVEAVHGIDLHLESGEFVAVLGANGAGKTSMMRGILGVADHAVSSYQLAGRDASRLSSHARIEAGISLVPEGREVFPTLTVRDNMRAAWDAKQDTNRTFPEALEYVTKLFPRLNERIGQLAGTLSGGEQQMLVIGRALVQEPTLLLLDEPSLGLAPIIIDSVMEVLADLNREGMTILMVEQDTERALEVVSRALVIRNGREVASGTPQELADPETLHAAIFGEEL